MAENRQKTQKPQSPSRKRGKTSAPPFANAAVKKGPDPKQLQKQAETARNNTYTFASKLFQEALGLSHDTVQSESRIKIGPIKKIEDIERKAKSQYDGDSRAIDDVCRAQMYTLHPKGLKKIIEFLKVEYNAANIAFANDKEQTPHRRATESLWSNVRIRTKERDDGNEQLKQPKNHVINPKRWGWMGLTLKLETQISKRYWVPFEIQIFPQGMSKAYEESHKLYKTIKSDVEEWEEACEERKAENQKLNTAWKRAQTKANDEVPLEEFFKNKPHVLATIQKILDIHQNAAKESGLEDLRKELGGKPFPTLKTLKPLGKNDPIEPIGGYELDDEPDIFAAEDKLYGEDDNPNSWIDFCDLHTPENYRDDAMRCRGPREP